MDDPACDEAMLLRTVDQFSLINRLVGRYRTILHRHVLQQMKRDPAREYHLLDLGAGGCDIPVWLLTEARRQKLKLRVTALDGDERIVRHAQKKCAGVNGLEIHHAPLSEMRRFAPVDFIFMNHVLHHLPDEIIPGVVREMAALARCCWIVSDLLRSRWAYTGFHLVGPFFTRSFAFEDGLRSIRRGFTSADLFRYTKNSIPSDRVTTEHLIPGRIVLIGRGDRI